MLHGGGQNRFSWKHTGQILADHGFHVIALTPGGHGDSDRSGAEYTVDAFSTDVTRVLDQIARRSRSSAPVMGGLTGIQVAPRAVVPQASARWFLWTSSLVSRSDGSARSRLHVQARPRIRHTGRSG